jgi:glycosyltransferase involved in cell wall biosynthesis
MTCHPELPPIAQALPVYHVPHWTTEDEFLLHKKPGIARQANQLVFFGRIQPYKGLNTLVRATLLLKGQFRTVIAGAGNLDEESLKLIAEHPELFELVNRYVTDAEIALLLQQSAVCALPYTHVTQSSVPMIAAAFGVPVVASRLGAFIEDVVPENGCLVPPQNPEAFAAAVFEAIKKAPRPLTDRSMPNTVARLSEMYVDVAKRYSRVH